MNLLLISLLLGLCSSVHAINIKIEDGGGRGNTALVSDIGQLITGTFDFNISSFAALSTVDTAQNFFKPVSGEKFVIDCLVYSGDRNIAANADATFVIYEATSIVSGIRSREIYQDTLSRGERFGQCGFNFLVNQGLFLNAETDDSTITLNILGYFIPAR